MPAPTRTDRSALGTRDLNLLSLLAFALKFAEGHWWVALPYALKAMGASDTAVGLSLALYMGAYAIALAISGTSLYRIGPHRLVRWSSLATLALTGVLATLLLVAQGLTNRPAWPLVAVMATTTLLGAVLAGFWPPLVEWISHGSKGAGLNRRLGRFSLSWCVGMLLSPYVAGRLVEVEPVWPVAAALAYLALAAALARLAKGPGDGAAEDGEAEKEEGGGGDEPDAQTQRAYRWMSRVALPAAFVAVGLSRTQLPLLFKFELGLSESQFGLAVTLIAIASTGVYVVTGRTRAWHWRIWPFVAGQSAVAAFLAGVLVLEWFPGLLLASAALGLGGAFVYASHLYYGICGPRRRARAMAIHEFVLAAGFCVGAVGGGALSDRLGHWAPYWLGLGVLAAGGVAQVIIWWYLTRRRVRMG